MKSFWKMVLAVIVGSLILSIVSFMLLSGFYTLVSLTAGIVIDISYGFIDPRIRMGAK